MSSLAMHCLYVPLTNASPTPALNLLLTIPDHVVCLLRKVYEAGEEVQCMRKTDLKQALCLDAHLHTLGLSTEWRGVRAAAANMTILKDNTIADAVGQRVARMLLVLNYKEICGCPQSHCPRPRRAGEKRKAYMINCIVYACFSRDLFKSKCDVIHNFLRQGRLLWIISSIVGLGFVLIYSDELMSTIKNVSITHNGVNAIAISTLYMRPRMVALLYSLEPAVADLMSGKISKALYRVIQDETGILGLSALSCTNGVYQAHLDHQYSTGNWEPVDLALAVHKIKERLCSRFRGAYFSVDYDSLNKTSTVDINL
ncbi:hypothetical protein BO85DRAFT_461013 [Aspergillus piperis CBS 112811]|uniref:Uncharacterized protein n=1 Tax=Aspergillus piperis CBS 112811 TaxID=1448313 RepID=A0A8G1QYJ0_9EURO|nr:hypothetical protein BO85DRAFT_461013 [Aspergillus piperis CBS 112811]RAH55922.1 hypothetical protein BO85DRAFT_461013 [Aspergillus piperis CBS 112811]